MDFSKHKLHRYLSEGMAISTGTQGSLDTSMKSSEASSNGGIRSKEQQTANKVRQQRQRTQMENSEYNKQLIKEKEFIRAIESQKSDWRTELQEKVADGQEREQHPFVTVMPTGDENLLQAQEQMAKATKKKKESVTEDVQELEEGKKKCKDGYKYDSEKKKCVKKKKKK